MYGKPIEASTADAYVSQLNFVGFPLVSESVSTPTKGLKLENVAYDRNVIARFAFEKRLAWHCRKSRLCVFDFDLNSATQEDAKNLLILGEFDPRKAFKSKSGGYHYYYILKDDFLYDYRNIYTPALDVLFNDNCYVRAYNPSTTSKIIRCKSGIVLDKLFKMNVNLNKKQRGETVVSSRGDEAALIPLLDLIDADEHYTLWGSIGRALKSLGFEFEVFEEWSKNGSRESWMACNLERTWEEFEPFEGDPDRFIRGIAGNRLVNH